MTAKHTEPEGAPKHAEPEGAPADTARRRMLAWLSGIIGGAIATAVGAFPILGPLIFPTRHRTVRAEEGFSDVAAAAELPEGVPVKVALSAVKYDAWNRYPPVALGAAWLVRRGAEVRAWSTVCPHLGCGIDHNPARDKFECPCHTSAFRVEDGAVLAGPSPRPLDPLEVKVEGGRVLVRYRRYVTGIAERRQA